MTERKVLKHFRVARITEQIILDTEEITEIKKELTIPQIDSYISYYELFKSLEK